MSESTGSTRGGRIQQRSLQRRAQQKLDLRRTILDAAIKLFEREGYEHFSLRQVAEAVGYSATTIYQHFTDKDDLLYHVALDGYTMFGRHLQTGYDTGTTSRERLHASGLAYVQFGLSYPVHYRLMFMQRGDFFHRPRPSGYEDVLDSLAVLTRIVQEGLNAGELRPRPAGDLTSLLWASVHGLVSLALATRFFEHADVAALYERHMEVLFREIFV
ncbi:TetR/AcrR family transcriptional regulator (plasmid) [Deinococcus sp. KNUC1210]|uniref:TetR/AcrR family transcriptional regulator n=1 Tax=Deinococcus sp. KNUC1210 TaxID=2917691 RepID=UPI001EF0A08B|nr:TetR/AcrR family transcriptional regulator [Deinococcus sp. KNUC1210]ULH14056.1 TetR/AcrR family transcriptional regulator [Deinococcus sp. KNUC1210]